ncbi:MAG: ROK family protein [Chloroflexota bacterium]|nr:ROK family protein [Chloroflexota bacterium]
MSEARVSGGTTAQPIEPDTLPPVVGVDLGGTQLRVAVMRGARLLSRVGLLTGEDPTPERIMPRIYEAIQLAVSEAGTTLAQIAGIGLGAPGPLDHHTGVIYSPPNLPGWTRVPVRDMLLEHFKTRVFVENDADCAALGEHMFGAGRGAKNMVYMTISTGIGGGIILNGKILEGASGTAGELGHMTIDWHGERCNCGNIGCLERIASGTAIARRANEVIAAGHGNELLAFARSLHTEAARPLALITGDRTTQEDVYTVTARTVSEAAKAGIPLAREIIARAAEGLGAGLVNIIHIFNPEVIILGGGVTQMGAQLLYPALHIVHERAMRVPQDSVRIALAELGANVGLVGAGALIYYHG